MVGRKKTVHNFNIAAGSHPAYETGITKGIFTLKATIELTVG